MRRAEHLIYDWLLIFSSLPCLRGFQADPTPFQPTPGGCLPQGSFTIRRGENATLVASPFLVVVLKVL